MTDVGARVEGGARSLEQGATELEERTWIKRGGRVGLFSRGMIYAVLTFLAFDVALYGRAPAQPSGAGALDTVARQPSGPLLVVVLAFGLALYGSWCLVQAASGQELGKGEMSATRRVGWLAVACVYFVLCAQAALAATTRYSSAGSAEKPAPVVATVLGWPAGPVLVGIVGFAIAACGLGLAAWALLHDHAGDLDKGSVPRGGIRATRVAGALGEATRGLWVLLVAIYLITSAVTDDAAHARGIGSALQSFVRDPAGPYLLGTGAVGLASFAAFSAMEALYRRM